MFAPDSLEHFGDKFARFPLCRDFVAIVEPLEDEGSALMRRLENIQHNALSAERMPDADKRNAARQIMVRLAKEIRETIRAETTISQTGEIPLDEMSEFFSEGVSDDRPPEKEAEKDFKIMTYEPAETRRPRRTTSGGLGAQGGAGGQRGKRGGGGGGTGGGTGTGRGGKGNRGEVRPIELSEVRHTPSPDGKANKRVVYFTPEDSGIASLTFEASGVNNSEKLDVVGADRGNAIRGALWVPVQQGKRNSVCVEFSSEYAGPVEMIAARVADAPDEPKDAPEDSR